MANLVDAPIWETGIYQFEVTDPAIGGVPNPLTGAGMANIPHLLLANRTLWLRDELLKSWNTDNSPANLGNSGTQKFGSGLFLKWMTGSLSAADTNGSTIAFPNGGFPNNCFGVGGFDLTTGDVANPNTGHIITVISTSVTKNSFRAFASLSGSPPTLSNTTAFFIALGS